jgi:hypothetical protein
MIARRSSVSSTARTAMALVARSVMMVLAWWARPRAAIRCHAP